jgi:hypothetical protein
MLWTALHLAGAGRRLSDQVFDLVLRRALTGLDRP